jgi:hypothetical protein
MSAIYPFRDRTLNIISDQDRDFYSYIINWISFLIQNPENKTPTALMSKVLVEIQI